MMWDNETIFGLADCPRASLRWAALGYRAGLRDGRDEVLAALGAAGEQVARSAGPTLGQPMWDVLRGRRQPDYQPCPAKCARCSTCIASLSFWARGGRPYLGAEAEAQLAAAS